MLSYLFVYVAGILLLFTFGHLVSESRVLHVLLTPLKKLIVKIASRSEIVPVGSRSVCYPVDEEAVNY